MALVDFQFTTGFKVVDANPEIRRASSNEACMVGVKGDCRDVVLSLDVLP